MYVCIYKYTHTDIIIQQDIQCDMTNNMMRSSEAHGSSNSCIFGLGDNPPFFMGKLIVSMAFSIAMSMLVITRGYVGIFLVISPMIAIFSVVFYHYHTLNYHDLPLSPTITSPGIPSILPL